MSEIREVVIIGSGPAGLTAAIYAARANLKPLVIAGFSWGGQLMTTTDVENFPGFPEGIQGPDLMQNLLKQAERFGAEIVYRDVVELSVGERPFSLSDGKNEYLAKAIVVATGARPRKLGIPGEDELWAKGVSSCATCDGAFYKEKVVTVVGGGDSAMEEALFLTKFASKVNLIHRREEFRASKIMVDRVEANEKINIVLNTTVESIEGEEVVEKVKVKDVESGEISEIPTDGFFLAIGHIPQVELVKDKITINELGYLEADQHTMSIIPGVFIAGDVHDHRYRQAVTAAAEGTKAAIDVERWLQEQE